jgi:nitrous oxidase accessory protein
MKIDIHYPINFALLAVLAILAYLIGSAGAANVTVGPGESIQAAIQEALPGDVIEVMSGTYNEELFIDKQLTLRGVDSGEGRPSLEAKGEDGEITFLEDGITFEGFSIKDFIIGVESDGNLVRDNIICCSTVGISIRGFGNNVSYNDIKSSWYLFSGGIILNSNNNTLLNNDVEANGLMGAGIYIVDCEDNIIRENRLKGGWLGNGLHILRSDRNIIIGNLAEDHHLFGRGIYIDKSDENYVIGNSATGGPRGCSIALMRSNNNTIVQNNLTDNVDSGIMIFHSSGNAIYMNNFAKNKNNAFSRNSTSLWSSPEPTVYRHGDKNFTASLGNFWSEYMGIDVDGDGIGDVSYSFEGGVDRFPLIRSREYYSRDVEDPRKIFPHEDSTA